MAGRLKPSFRWLSPLVGNCERGGAVSGAVFVFTCFSTALCIQLQFSSDEMRTGIWWTVLLAAFFIICLAGCMYTHLFLVLLTLLTWCRLFLENLVVPWVKKFLASYWNLLLYFLKLQFNIILLSIPMSPRWSLPDFPITNIISYFHCLVLPKDDIQVWGLL